MDEKKKIEEMAKDLQETHDYAGCEAWHCGGCHYGGNYLCSSIKQSEKMFAKGYRKQIEVAREMQTRLAINFGTYTEDDAVTVREVLWIVAKIAEEMLEENL